MNRRNSESAKKSFGTITALALAALIGAPSALASVIQFNTSGAGSTGAMLVDSAIGVHGTGFVMVQPDPTNPMGYVFSETGAYQLTQADGSTPIGAHDVTLAYSVTGALNPVTGALSFTTGFFNLYSDPIFNFGTASDNPAVVFGANDGALIASFLISAGTGSASGNVHMEGDAIAGSIRTGFFFSSIGEDLSQSGRLHFDLDINNVADLSPSGTAISELVCKASHFPGPGCNGTDYFNTPYYFVVTDGGTAFLSTPVPEPGSMALAFAGLAGLGFSSRRSSRKK